jgi:acyl-CoA hydrolase
MRKSTVVALHPAGTVITLTRAAVDFVATEYGLAALRGVPVRERVRALIALAHPDYRDELTEEAMRLRFM